MPLVSLRAVSSLFRKGTRFCGKTPGFEARPLTVQVLALLPTKWHLNNLNYNFSVCNVGHLGLPGRFLGGIRKVVYSCTWKLRAKIRESQKIW